jgi:hypothetical protein
MYSIPALVYFLLRTLLGMQVVKLGGPVYRIGVGGGSASSIEVRKLTTISTILMSYMQGLSRMAWLFKLWVMTYFNTLQTVYFN